MLSADDQRAAVAASQLLRDSVAQFYDADRRAGRAFARSLGAPDQVAWDMYLAYAPDAQWLAGTPPPPVAFAHQLPGSWAAQARCFTGEDLRRELSAMVRAIV